MAMGQARTSLARWFGSASASSAYQLTNRLIVVASDHAHYPKRSDPIPSLDPSPYRVRMTGPDCLTPKNHSSLRASRAQPPLRSRLKARKNPLSIAKFMSKK